MNVAADLRALLDRLDAVEREVVELRQGIAELEDDRDQAYRVVGRLRSGCRAALTDLLTGEYRPFTVSFLKEVLS